MTVITDIPRAWFSHWQQASFRAVPFFVEIGAKGSGRRTVLHQFPKRDVPYAEDMGREAYAFPVTGYLIEAMAIQFGFGDYVNQRDALEAALETEGGGALVLPTRRSIKASCIRYNCTERRTEGGFCQFDMVFVESGEVNNPLAASVNPPQAVNNAGNVAAQAMATSFNNSIAVAAAVVSTIKLHR